MAEILDLLNDTWILVGILGVVIVGALLYARTLGEKATISKGNMVFEGLEGFTLGRETIPFTKVRISRIEKVKTPNGQEETYKCIAYDKGGNPMPFTWPSYALTPWVVFGGGQLHKNIRLITDEEIEALRDVSGYQRKIATLEADLRDAAKTHKAILSDYADIIGDVKKKAGLNVVPPNSDKKNAERFNAGEEGG